MKNYLVFSLRFFLAFSIDFLLLLVPVKLCNAFSQILHLPVEVGGLSLGGAVLAQHLPLAAETAQDVLGRGDLDAQQRSGVQDLLLLEADHLDEPKSVLRQRTRT